MADEILFDELYKLLRGSSVAAAFIEAQTLYGEERLEESLLVLEKMVQSYSNSRQSTINKDLSEAKRTPKDELDKETKRLVRKQEKAKDALSLAQELLEQIRREIRKKSAVSRLAAPSVGKALSTQESQTFSTQELSTAFLSNSLTSDSSNSISSLEEAFKALRESLSKAEDFDERKKQIEKLFDTILIASESELKVNDVLLAISGGTQHILIVEKVIVEKSTQKTDSGHHGIVNDISADILNQRWLLGVRLALTGTHMKPIPFESLRLSISKAKLFRLELRRSENSVSSDEASKLPYNAPANESVSSEDSPTDDVNLSASERDQILDMGAFSQLIDSAQRTGIVPGISIIVQVRDCEYRLGRYSVALQLMESQFSILIGNAVQRAQRLKREEQDIASGRIKMSPRELQAKKARDNQETESIERAKTKFTRVIEGLRGLMHAKGLKLASLQPTLAETKT